MGTTGAALPTPWRAALRQAWKTRRDAWLADPRFQRWASGFLPTRPIAQRRAGELFDLVAGFVYSQVLLACVRLRLFERLADGPQPLDALAAQLGLQDAAAERLVAAAVSLRLLERRDGDGVGLGPLGAAMAGNPGIAAMVEHHVALYADLADPVALLRGERPDAALAAYWPYAAADAPARLATSQVADYSALMAASQALVADQILDAYPVRRHRCLLDVGGGEGAFLIAAAQRAPSLRLVLFDLPAVAERAQRRFDGAGLGVRAIAVGGDFHRRPLPQGADLVTLVRVVHDHDDAQALRLLRAAHAALPPGGTLLLAEPLAATHGAERMGDAYFGFYLLAMGSGRPRRRDELFAMLVSAGFDRLRELKTRMPLQCSVLVARRPDGVESDPH